MAAKTAGIDLDKIGTAAKMFHQFSAEAPESDRAAGENEGATDSKFVGRAVGIDSPEIDRCT